MINCDTIDGAEVIFFVEYLPELLDWICMEDDAWCNVIAVDCTGLKIVEREYFRFEMSLKTGVRNAGLLAATLIEVWFIPIDVNLKSGVVEFFQTAVDILVKFWLTAVLFKAQVTVEELSDLDVLVTDMSAKGVVYEGTMNNEVLVTRGSISDDAFMVGLDMVGDSTLEFSSTDDAINTLTFSDKPTVGVRLRVIEEYINGVPDKAVDREKLFNDTESLKTSEDETFVEVNMVKREFSLDGAAEEKITEVGTWRTLLLLLSPLLKFRDLGKDEVYWLDVETVE